MTKQETYDYLAAHGIDFEITEHMAVFNMEELDAAFGDGLIGVHPNDNTASVWLKAPDMVKVIEEHGNTVNIVEI